MKELHAIMSVAFQHNGASFEIDTKLMNNH